MMMNKLAEQCLHSMGREKKMKGEKRKYDLEISMIFARGMVR